MKISPGFGQAEKYSEEYQSNNLGSIDRQWYTVSNNLGSIDIVGDNFIFIDIQ
jgi:hypothetical protein